jgi:hypothetical protein
MVVLLVQVLHQAAMQVQLAETTTEVWELKTLAVVAAVPLINGAPSGVGGAGGDGIVIIRYDDALGQRAGGGTVTTPSGYIVHTFTGNGTFATNADFGGS